MLQKINLELRAKRRGIRSLQEKHVKYMLLGLKSCSYIKKTIEELISEEKKLTKKIDLLTKVKRLVEFKLDLSYKTSMKIRRIKHKFKLTYLENIIKFFVLMIKMKKFQKKNFNSENKVSIKELYTPEAISAMDRFFKEKYNISLKEIENDISIYKISFDSFYEELKTPFAAAYFAGGKYKKSVMVTDYVFQGNTMVDDGVYNSELLVHELTHYLQFTKGYAKPLDMIKSSLANLHLMITGSTKYYMEAKLERDARFNQEDYKHFLLENELIVKSTMSDIFDKLFSTKTPF